MSPLTKYHNYTSFPEHNELTYDNPISADDGSWPARISLPESTGVQGASWPSLIGGVRVTRFGVARASVAATSLIRIADRYVANRPGPLDLDHVRRVLETEELLGWCASSQDAARCRGVNQVSWTVDAG